MGNTSKDEKQFKLQADLLGRTKAILIPWSHAEHAYVEYSRRFGTGQSLERIHQRGGFGVEEMIMLLCDRISYQEEKINLLQEGNDRNRQVISSLRRRLRETGRNDV